MELLVSLPSQCYVKQTFCMLGAAGSHFAKRHTISEAPSSVVGVHTPVRVHGMEAGQSRVGI